MGKKLKEADAEHQDTGTGSDQMSFTELELTGSIKVKNRITP